MLMIPQRIRTFKLTIRKRARWIPLRNLRRPTHRYAVPAQPVANQRPRLQLLRSVHHAEVEPRRSDLLQIFRPGEEREYFVDRLRQPLLAFQSISMHPPPRNSDL